MKSFVLLVFFLGFQFPAIGKFIVEIPKLESFIERQEENELISVFRAFNVPWISSEVWQRIVFVFPDRVRVKWFYTTYDTPVEAVGIHQDRFNSFLFSPSGDVEAASYEFVDAQLVKLVSKYFANLSDVAKAEIPTPGLIIDGDAIRWEVYSDRLTISVSPEDTRFGNNPDRDALDQFLLAATWYAQYKEGYFSSSEDDARRRFLYFVPEQEGTLDVLAAEMMKTVVDGLRSEVQKDRTGNTNNAPRD